MESERLYSDRLIVNAHIMGLAFDRIYEHAGKTVET